MACYGYGYGCGSLCGPVCLQCYCPKIVDGCPVQIKCGAIVPDPFVGACNPCYGGINVPAHGCGRVKCCEKTTACCGLAPKKQKSQWVKPGSVTEGSACGCCC